MEEGARALIEAEELQEVRALVARTRLAVTELVDRARLGRMHSMELRAAGQLLRLISLELVQREVVCAAECIQRLEAEERLSLLEAEHRLCGSLRALAVCHAVWAGLQRLQRAEAAARGALRAAAGAAGALLLQLAAEPRRRHSVAAAEAFQWGVLCGSLALSSEEQQARRRIEVDAAAKHPNIDAWLLMTAAHRERLWLLACQRLQRWEIAERRRLVFYRLPVLHKARQQCVRPFLEQQLAILQRRELKARKLVAAWEAVPRALLSAQDALFVAAQRRRATVMAAEQRDRRWLAVSARCVMETYLNRQRVAAKQREEWAAIVQGALPVVVLCRTISLQKAEVHQRAAISTQWHSGFQLLELITIRIAEDEAVGRAAIWRQYRAGASLFALQGWEFERRRTAMGAALGTVQGLADRCHLIAAWLRGRRLLHRETDSAWTRLLFQQLREQEVLGRQELQAGCLEALVRCQPCRAVELQELRARGPLQAEEAAAFADIQVWRVVTYRFVQQLSAVRTPLLEQEELERHDLYRSARVSQRMAKVSTDLRLAQESRAREGAPARKGVERRAAFLTVPLGDMDLLLMSPARLNGPPARSPPSRRNSHRAAAVPASGAS